MSQKCPHCRFTIPSDATVCGYCGAEKRTVVTEPYNPENQAGIFGAVIGAVLVAFFAWSNTKTFKGLFGGLIIGFIVGWWLPLISKLISAVIGAVIGLVIGLIISKIFSWGLIPMAICSVIGFFAGYFHEKTEDRWFR